ncbi:MAG: hypothetical protein IKJ28_03875 [Alphaproteobacteria bacterium]|nr:hypothetical protein [Alphaproteobacteria bacterium]
MRRLICSGREYVISATAIVFVSIPTTVAGCFSGGVRGDFCKCWHCFFLSRISSNLLDVTINLFRSGMCYFRYRYRFR